MRARARSKEQSWYKDRRLKRNRAVKGRLCKYQHCQVDDEFHIGNWNSAHDICPSCNRQRHREPHCPRCDGPQYRDRFIGENYCPNCNPRCPSPGQILVVLVCLETGREREIIRGPSWTLPDGRLLANAHEDGIIVLDLEPKLWAKYRV